MYFREILNMTKMIIILLKSLSNVNLIIIEDKRRAKLNELGIVI